MNSRVRELKLNLKVHEEHRDLIGKIQYSVRNEFVVGVLESMEQALHARFGPNSIVRVRTLSVRWSIEMQQLADRDYARKIGEELAEEIVTRIVHQPSSVRLRPTHSLSAVLFDDATHMLAARLSDESESKADAWFHRGFFTESDAWSQTCATGTTELRRVISFLARMDTLKAVLGKIDAVQLRSATTVLPLAEWPPEALRALRTTSLETEPLPKSGSRMPSAENSEIPGRRPPDPAGLPPEATPLEASGAVEARSAIKEPRPEKIEPVPREGVWEPRRTEPTTISLERDHQPLDGALVQDALVTDEERPFKPGVQMGDRGFRDALPQSTVLARLLETQFGGLFYLLNPILELDLAENLWCAGVKEGEFLCHVARLLLSEEGAVDPAPRILGGIPGDRDPQLAKLPAWAVAEIRSKSLESLRALLVRRQAPGHLTENLQTKTDDLAAVLAPLPTQGLDDLETARAVKHCAAVAIWAFGGRLGEALDQNAFLDVIRIPGQIEPGADEIRIHLPIEAIEIRVRRAGLDFNPGHLPWLKRKLLVIFE